MRWLAASLPAVLIAACSAGDGDDGGSYDGQYHVQVYRTSTYPLTDDRVCADLGEGDLAISNLELSGSYINSYGESFLIRGRIYPDGFADTGPGYVSGGFYSGIYANAYLAANFSGNMGTNEKGDITGSGQWEQWPENRCVGIWEATYLASAP